MTDAVRARLARAVTGQSANALVSVLAGDVAVLLGLPIATGPHQTRRVAPTAVHRSDSKDVCNEPS